MTPNHSTDRMKGGAREPKKTGENKSESDNENANE